MTDAEYVAVLRRLLAEAEAEARKWRRIRTPTHGSCCTCQGCGLAYDDCRCDLDDLADELAQAKARVAELEAACEAADVVLSLTRHDGCAGHRMVKAALAKSEARP